MNGSIAVTPIKAYVQENGIIRIEETGLYIGRLDGVEYEELAPFKIPSVEKKQVTIDVDQLEHLLNCMANQRFIHEQNEEMQKEWQGIIDKSWNDGMALLHPPQAIESTE